MATPEWTRPLYEAPYVPLSVVNLDRTPPTSTLLLSIKCAGATSHSLTLPTLWPCPSTDLSLRMSGSAAWLCWNESGLHALFDVRGPFLSARDTVGDKLSIHGDSRVELFVCPESALMMTAHGAGAMRYRGFELNSAGRCLDFAVAIGETGDRQFEYGWTGYAVGVMQQTDEQAGEGEACESSSRSRLYRVSIPWQDIGVSPPLASSGGEQLLVGLYRGEVVDSSAQHAEHLWTSGVDPLSPDVNFHTHRTFAALRLLRDK